MLYVTPRQYFKANISIQIYTITQHTFALLLPAASVLFVVIANGYFARLQTA